MTPAEATAALTYANQLDPLVPLNEASADLWAHALATVTVDQARWVIRDYYERQGADGKGRSPVNPALIRKYARTEIERAAAKRAALDAKPAKSYDAALSTWRSRNPDEWDALVRDGAHDQWSRWNRAGEADRACRCGCGSAPTASPVRL